jgi:hypothetical protein
MGDFNPRPEVRPEAFQFVGATNGGSFVRSGPRSPFSDAEEMELALELLGVTSEAELEQFLGDLFKKAWRGIKRVGSKVIGPLGGLLKTVAKKALPFLATAAGTFFGGPAGGAIAGKLGSLVSQALEAEVAGMAAADRDLEKSRQFVRLAGQAARAAASAPTGANPIAVAQKILADSAKEMLARKAAPAARAGNFAERALPAATMKTAAAAGRAAPQKSRTGTQAPGERSCSICEQPPGSCQCGKIGRSGRWFRSGGSIIVNC